MILDLAVKLVLAPVLGIQALKVRNRALHLPEASGPRDGAIGSGPLIRLLIVGDSSAAGVGVATQSQALSGQLAAALASRFSVQWHLHAKTGATTASTLKSLDNSTFQPADIVVTALGVNDVTHAVPCALWLRRQRNLRALLRERTGVKRLYVTGLPPLAQFPLLPDPLRWVLGRTATRFDRALSRSLRGEEGCVHVPQPTDLNTNHMAADGFHPGPEIYALWAKEMASRIIADWPEIRSNTLIGKP